MNVWTVVQQKAAALIPRELKVVARRTWDLIPPKAQTKLHRIWDVIAAIISLAVCALFYAIGMAIYARFLVYIVVIGLAFVVFSGLMHALGGWERWEELGGKLDRWLAAAGTKHKTAQELSDRPLMKRPGSHSGTKA